MIFVGFVPLHQKGNQENLVLRLSCKIQDGIVDRTDSQASETHHNLALGRQNELGMKRANPALLCRALQKIVAAGEQHLVQISSQCGILLLLSAAV